MEPLLIKNTISINASPAQVWDALVNPSKTKQYMFGCEALSDWKVGSSLNWQMVIEGKEFIAVKGNIISIAPEKTLSYSVFDPNSSMPDIAENYLTVTYDLSIEGSCTRLQVTQGDYHKVAEGEKRYKESYNNGEGWNPILIQIKALLEK